MRPSWTLLPMVLLALGCAAESADPVDRDGDGVVAQDDCDDDDASVYPGAPELCDGVDNDCDGVIDPASSEDAATWYADMDGDGFGDPATAVTACEAPEGHVGDDADCDDTTDAVHPGADELCDGVDNDCDEVVDPPSSLDAPTWYPDADADGFGDASAGAPSCSPNEGWISDGQDCDDADMAVNPEAEEICDGIDNDCDAATAEDGMVSWVSPEGDAPVDVTEKYTLDSETFTIPAVPLPFEVGGTLQFCRGRFPMSLRDAGGVDAIRGMTGDASDVMLDGEGVAGVIRVFWRDLAISDLTIQNGNGAWSPLGVTEGEQIDWRKPAGGLNCTRANPRSEINDEDPVPTLTLRNVIFRDNVGLATGGALSVFGCALDAEDVVFEDNTTSGNGGALYADPGDGRTVAPVTVVGGTFTGNEAPGDGGAIYAGRVTTTLEDVTISDNGAGKSGGAVFFGYGELSVLDSTFEGNEAGGSGGALYVQGTDTWATLTDSSIIDNTAGTTGGGVLAGFSLELDGTRVDRNTASRGGGVWFAAGGGSGELTCDGRTGSAGFHGNTSEDTSFNGAVVWLGTSLTLTQCDFGETGTDDDNTPIDLMLALDGGSLHSSDSLGDEVTCTVTCERSGAGCAQTCLD